MDTSEDEGLTRVTSSQGVKTVMVWLDRCSETVARHRVFAGPANDAARPVKWLRLNYKTVKSLSHST